MKHKAPLIFFHFAPRDHDRQTLDKGSRSIPPLNLWYSWWKQFGNLLLVTNEVFCWVFVQQSFLMQLSFSNQAVAELRSSLQRMLGPLFFHAPLDGHELSLSCLDPAAPAIKPNCPASSINVSPHKAVNNWSMGHIRVCVHVSLWACSGVCCV